jgi:hypothetical protein
MFMIPLRRSAIVKEHANLRYLGGGVMRGQTWGVAARRALFAVGAIASVTSPARAQRKTGTLTGIVRDDAGAPVVSVEVAAIKHGIVARTDSVGRFILATLPSGALDLTFRRLAFEPVVVTIDLPANDTTEVEVKLTVVAQRLTGVVVNDRAPKKKRVLEGFEARRRQGIGYFVTREQIEKRDPRLLSDMLRMIPGTILIAGDAGRITLRFTRSARNCPPQFFVDGIQATGMGIDDVSPIDVEGVEIFAGAAGLPSEFARMRSTSNCGTVLIWTRIPGV